MAVPARPASGAPIESAWGGIAHDTAVAQDFQSGSVVVTTAGSPPIGATVVTFPRPFAVGSTPIVMVCGNGTGTDNMVCSADAVTATTVRINLRAASIFGYTCRWFAIGPRA